MDFKRIFKTPLFWVLAVIVVMLTVFSFDGNGGYTTVTTAQAEKLIAEKKVDKAVLTTENVLTMDLKNGQTFTDESSGVSGATKVRAEFVVGYGLDYAEAYRGLRVVGTLAPHVYS